MKWLTDKKYARTVINNVPIYGVRDSRAYSIVPFYGYRLTVVGYIFEKWIIWDSPLLKCSTYLFNALFSLP